MSEKLIVIYTVLLLAFCVGLSLAQSEDSLAESQREDLPEGFKDAVKILPGSEANKMQHPNKLLISPKAMVFNKDYYGCLDQRNRVYQINLAITIFRAVDSFGTRDEEFREITQFDYQDGNFLTVTPERLYFSSLDGKSSIPNRYHIISAVLDGENILAINRNEHFNDMEHLLIRMDREGNVLQKWKKDVGIKPPHRNMAVTYELKRLGNGGVAVFSRFTGEIIPGLDKTVTANILNDPYANTRASYNIRKLGEYLRNMSGRADYVDVIDDVVVNDTMAVALCYTDDRVYLKRVPEGDEETPAYWFEYQGSLAAGAHFYNDVIYIFSLFADRHGDIVFRYRVKMEQ